MRCKNRYCYNELNGRCTVPREIFIDGNGRCAVCFNIRPTEETVNEIKNALREELRGNMPNDDDYPRPYFPPCIIK